MQINGQKKTVGYFINEGIRINGGNPKLLDLKSRDAFRATIVMLQGKRLDREKFFEMIRVNPELNNLWLNICQKTGCIIVQR